MTPRTLAKQVAAQTPKGMTAQDARARARDVLEAMGLRAACHLKTSEDEIVRLNAEMDRKDATKGKV
jgi:uncharacterized small protein (DUF1192 family)